MSEKIGFEELRSKYKDVLSKAFATNNIDLLDSYSKSNANETDRKSAMDQAFRDKLLDLLGEDLECLENYVCFCIESCRRQMASPTMPVVLLGDIFDALTLSKCEKLFSYVENGVNIWKEELFFLACKNNLLRMCNDLLRRLSRSQNTVFCGRILLFLAKFFPFSERSGLNIVSEFNLENVTEFGGENSSHLNDTFDEEMVIEDGKNKLSIDYNLYCKFWSLQDYFRNPNTCYNKLQWKTFVAHSSSVLSAFSSYKLEAVELQKSKLNRLKTVNMDVDTPESNKEQHYFAKFLTNQKLLELQLSDNNFRRCVLIQFLILFQYLTSSVKFKIERYPTQSSYGQKRENPFKQKMRRKKRDLIKKLRLAKAMGDKHGTHQIVRGLRSISKLIQEISAQDQFEESQELKPDQCEWVKETTAQVYRLLGETAGDGRRFATCVRRILRREEHWNNWKNDGCKEFQKPKPPVQLDSPEDTKKAKKRRRPLGDIVREYDANGKSYMGHPELTKLWNLCPDNLSACRTKKRDFMPPLKTYMLSAVERASATGTTATAAAAAAAGGGGAAAAAGAGWGWRALRLLARRSPHFFVHTNNPIGRLPDYLDDMIKRVTREVTPTETSNGDAAAPTNGDKQNKTEPAEEEITEEQIEADLIKEGDTNDIEQVPDSTDTGEDYEKPQSRVTMITEAQLDAVSAKLVDWRKLATKLGFKPDEIQYFESENPTEPARAKNMLQLWFDDDEDASVENLLYIMEGLELMEACEALKGS